MEQFEEDAIDATPGSLHQSNPAKHIGEPRVPRCWLMNEEIVERDSAREPAGIGDDHAIRVPLHVDGMVTAAISMEDRVVDGFTESVRGIVRYRQAEESNGNLLLGVPRREALLDVLQSSKKWAAEAVVDADLAVVAKHLKLDRVTREDVAQDLLSADEQHPRHVRDEPIAPGPDETERFQELFVVEPDKGTVSSPADDRLPQTLNLERVERPLVERVEDLRGHVEEAQITAVTLVLVRVER